jgi:hypothetical protein
MVESFAGSFFASSVESVSQNNSIHRAGTGTADSFNLYPIIRQQAIQDSPGKSAMSATALQCKFNELQFSILLSLANSDENMNPQHRSAGRPCEIGQRRYFLKRRPVFWGKFCVLKLPASQKYESGGAAFHTLLGNLPNL